MKRLIFTLFALLSILTAGAQEFVIIATGSNGQPEAHPLNEISSWGYEGENFFINDENQTQVFSTTGNEFNFSSEEKEEGEYFVATFLFDRQAKFLIGPDLKINWKDSKLTIEDKNRSGEFLLEYMPELSIERGTFGYVDPYIIVPPYIGASSLYFRCEDKDGGYTSFSNAYTASIDKDYFYFFDGPAGMIKISRSGLVRLSMSDVSAGMTYR